MGLKIHSGFRKFVTGAFSDFARKYLQLLEEFGKGEGLQSFFWQYSRESVLDLDKGRVSANQFLDLCTERTLQMNTPSSNFIAVIWTLRNEAHEHAWRLRLVFSQMPHFQADFLEASCVCSKDEKSFLKAQTNRLLRTGVADIIFTSDQISGVPHWVYLDTKIRASKELSRQFRQAVWSGDNIMGSLAAVLERELADLVPNPVTLAHAATDRFIKECDERLMASLGPTGFSAAIEKTGLSLQQWLELCTAK